MTVSNFVSYVTKVVFLSFNGKINFIQYLMSQILYISLWSNNDLT